MEHSIIACFYPNSDRWQRALAAIQSNPRHVPAALLQATDDRDGRQGRLDSHGRLDSQSRLDSQGRLDSPGHLDRHQRESTEPPANPGASALDYLPSLVVRLGDVPRTDKGLIFGSNPNCDVHIQGQGISNIHFSLTFDEFNRPIIQDLNSLVGTEVTYEGEGNGARRDFRWIIGGHNIPGKMTRIVITIPGVISFQVIVRSHNIKSPAYIDGVGRFKQGTAANEALLEDLGLSNPPTRGGQTPGTGDIFLKKNLGEGSFGVVTHHWNVSTGEEHVVKTPHSKAIRNKEVDLDAWKHEAHIMSLISHRHIVKLIEAFFDPQPALHLEYMSCGSLSDHDDISYNETLTILRQCSSALAYLHGQQTPIAHRDIKPANILIESRSEDGILVKLADFGLARHGFELSTLCGTYVYLAPEIHSDDQRRARKQKTLGYSTTVDIWSLGVVAYELLYGLPPFKPQDKADGVAWCEKIDMQLRRHVQRRPTALGSMLVKCMVVLAPESRCRASECCNILEKMPMIQEDYVPEDVQAAFRESDDAEDLSTIVLQPRSRGATTTPNVVRSSAPPPDSSGESGEGGSTIGVDDYEEMERAALLLQAIAGGKG